MYNQCIEREGNKPQPETKKMIDPWQGYTGWRIDTTDLHPGEEHEGSTVEESPLELLTLQDFRFLEESEEGELVENGPDWLPFMAKVYTFEDESVYLECIRNLTAVAHAGLTEEDRRISKGETKKKHKLLSGRTAYRALRHVSHMTHSEIMRAVRNQ